MPPPITAATPAKPAFRVAIGPAALCVLVVVEAGVVDTGATESVVIATAVSEYMRVRVLLLLGAAVVLALSLLSVVVTASLVCVALGTWDSFSTPPVIRIGAI